MQMKPVHPPRFRVIAKTAANAFADLRNVAAAGNPLPITIRNLSSFMERSG